MRLIGREDALRAVDARLSALPRRGGALLIRGRRGLGRSGVLEVAAARAEGLGFAVLAGGGEAGLDRLLRPLRPAGGASLDRLGASVAVLEALAEAARRRPIVVLVDDAERLDAGERERLAFAARRLDAIGVAVIATASASGTGGFDTVDLAPLRDDDARSLLAGYGLPRRVEDAVLATAEGVPLALTELTREAAPCAEALAAEPIIELPVGWRLSARGDRAAADLSAWPYLRARLLLAQGERLRRDKRSAEATDALRAARDELLMLGAQPLVERAERELRAAGGGRAPGLGELTPHELRIARLAADGLSNPEIGARLAVSPRTISSHLYRVFPKLGVTSRAQLKAALAD